VFVATTVITGGYRLPNWGKGGGATLPSFHFPYSSPLLPPLRSRPLKNEFGAFSLKI